MADPDYPMYDPGYPGSSIFKSGGPPAGARKSDVATDPAFAWLSQYMPWNRPTYPSGAPPAPAQPPMGASPTGPVPGQAQQFMGVPQKRQDRFTGAAWPGGRVPDVAGAKGGLMQPAPGGAPQPPQGGAGVSSGGDMPAQQGPLTLQGVMQSLAQANPDMMKTREGRITLGMAAVRFAPLMQRQDQMEMQRMKMELANQINMLKLQQGEAKLGMQEARLEAYQSKLDKGTDLTKNLETAIKERDTVANHLAQQPNSKELKQAYADANKRVEDLNKKISPPSNEKAFADWLGEAAKASDPVAVVLSEVPQDISANLRPEEQRQLAEMLLKEPIKAHMRITRLREKLRGGETTVGKSYGDY